MIVLVFAGVQTVQVFFLAWEEEDYDFAFFIRLALVSAGVKVLEGWEDHPASLGVTVTLVGVLGPGVAGVLGMPGLCLTPSNMMIPR